jgi:hypothetical protein
MTQMKKSLIILITILSGIATYGQTTRYVKTTASGTGDGSSWANASADLHAMINASAANDMIWVAAGTYVPTQDKSGSVNPNDSDNTFYISKNIKIYGGFAGTESSLSERNLSVNQTILSGDMDNDGDNTDNAFTIVHIDGTTGNGNITSSTVIDAFTIEKAYADDFNNKFENYGGGMFLDGAGSGNECSPIISNCQFLNNYAIFGGAAIYCDGDVGKSNPNIINSTFYANATDADGGAVTTNGGDGESTANIVNCTFASNTNSGTGATAIVNGRVSGINNTAITNCIFWSNGSTPIFNANASITLNYCIFDDGTQDGTVNLPSGTTGSNNIEQDPLFVNLASGNLNISTGSPAINIGDNTTWLSNGLVIDIAGNNRPQNITVDVGAYELGVAIAATDYFITTWTTTSSNESITIPTNSGQTYNYDVDWGDSNNSTQQTGDATHTYATAGTYTVKIYNLFPQIDFFSHNGTSHDKIQTIEQWGTIEWASMSGAFWGCTNLDITNGSIDAPDLSNVTSMSYMFSDCANFNGGNLNAWDVSNVQSAQDMFSGATTFNQPLNNWVVSSVTNMSSMFGGATAFNQNLGSWNISSVSNMNAMFSNSGMDTDNYDMTLMGWSAQTVQSGVTVGATGLIYCGSKAERQSLITNDSWSFDGDAILNCACPATTSAGQWIGCAGDGLWTTATNWFGDVLPTSTTDVSILNGDAVTIPSGTVTVKSITLTFGSTLTNASNLIISGFTDKGIDAATSGCIITNNGNLSVSGGTTGIYSKDNVNNNGLLGVSGTSQNGIELIGSNLTNSGSIVLSSIGASGIYVGGDLTNNASGDITVGSAGQVGIEIDGSNFTNHGNISMSGGKVTGLDAANVVNTGQIDIDGTSNRAMIVSTSFDNSSGTIKGTGNYELGTASNIDLAGTVSPGSTIGTMTFTDNQTFTASSTLKFDIASAASHDQIIVSGTATISGALNASVTYTPTTGDRIEIISATSISGTFSSDNLPFDWSIEYSATKVELVYSAIIGKWDGEVGDGLWSSANNWEGGMLPTSSDNVIIDNGDAVTLSTGTATVNTITMSNNSDLNISSGATLNVNKSTNSQEVIDLDGSGVVLTNAGDLNITGGSRAIDLNSSATLTNQSGGMIDLGTSSTGIDADAGKVNNYGTITKSSGSTGIFAGGSSDINNHAGGVMTFNNSSSIGINIEDANFLNDGTINISGGSGIGILLGFNPNEIDWQNAGTINISNVGDFGMDIIGNSNINKLNNTGNITITNAGADGIFLRNSLGELSNSGNLTISGSTGKAINSSTSIVTNTGTLKGTGTFDTNNGLAGTVSPGTSPGTMTFPANQTLSGTLEVEINGTTAGTQHDQITVTGTATIGGTLNATIDYLPTNSDRIVIISATTISGTFSTISPALPADWAVDYSQTGEVALVYSGVSLPVELIDFRAKKTNDATLLTWQTATEINNSHFEIEWSNDGRTFEKIGEIAGVGDSDEVQFYEFLHSNPSDGINYYRLRQIDFDGEFDYSGIVSIEFENENIQFKIYPNPATDFIIIKDLEEGEAVQIFDVVGKEVKAFQIQSSLHELPISDLPSGTYFIKTGRAFGKFIIRE